MLKLLKPVQGILTQRFGARPEFYKKFGFAGHEGVDWGAPIGTPVYASYDGVIRIVFPNGVNYGNHLRLLHVDPEGKRFETVYAHLDKFADSIFVGKAVKQGDLIGYVGNTGNSSGPHLHFHVRWQDRIGVKGYPSGIVNPESYFKEGL